MPNVGDDIEELEPCHTAGGNVNGMITLESGSEVP